MDKNIDSCPIVGNGDIRNNVSFSKNPETTEQVLPFTSQVVQNTMGVRKNYKRVVSRGKKGSQILTGKNNSLRSSQNDSKSSPKIAPAEPLQTPVQPPAEKRKRGRPSKGSPRKSVRPSNRNPTDEFSQIRKRVRYILNRMNYEQSLIQAYASEGWKNQRFVAFFCSLFTSIDISENEFFSVTKRKEKKRKENEFFTLKY
jgi:hypothetical protein